MILSQSLGDGHRLANTMFGSFKAIRPRTLVNINNVYNSATHKMEFPSGLGIQFLSILVKQNIGAAAALDGSELMLMSIDAVDDLEAAANLGAGDVPAYSSMDAPFWALPIGVVVNIPLVQPLENGTLGGGRLDFRAIGTKLYDVYVGAN